MAFETIGFVIPGVVAASDLSAAQHKVCVINSAGKVALQATGGAKFDGVLQDKPTADQAASVMVTGVTKALAGATVTAGDLVMVDATSRLVTATATNFAGGRALTGGAVGTLLTVLLNSYGTV